MTVAFNPEFESSGASGRKVRTLPKKLLIFSQDAPHSIFSGNRRSYENIRTS